MNSSCILPMYTLEQLKHSAKLIRKYLETLNITVSHSTALDIASNGIGFQNYNIAKASIEKVEVISSEYMMFKPNFQAAGMSFDPDNQPERSISIDEFKREKDTTLYEFVKPEKMPTTSGLFGFNKKVRPLTLEDMFYNGKTIPFVENSSTVLMSSARFGKSTVMRTWAESMIADSKPFVYFLTRFHFSSLFSESKTEEVILRGQDEHSSRSLINLETTIDQFKADGASALIKVNDFMRGEGKEDTFDEIKSAVLSAMEKGYHIFIDENKYRINLLELLQNRGYNNFTIALQGFDHLSYENKPVSLLQTDRILIGKSNDHEIVKGYESIGIKLPRDVLYRLPVGHFMIAKRSLKERS